MIKSALPEGTIVADPVRERRESFRSGSVMGLAPVAAIANQPGTLQSGQVLRNHWLRHTRALRQSVNGLLAVASESLEDGPASRIGEGLEETVCGVRHGKTITERLWIVNSKFCMFLAANPSTHEVHVCGLSKPAHNGK